MEDHNSPEAVAQRSAQEDPIVMYLIVRETLGMSIGKACAQCAHASQMLLLQFKKLEKTADWTASALGNPTAKRETEKVVAFEKWLDTSFRKVVLKADDKEWAKLKAEVPEHVIVVDAGLTEIAAGSETVIGLWPMRKSERPKIVTKLQVLK